MYLSKIRIRNFRSIKDVEIKIIDGKNIIVGRNSVGKSNIFSAINIVLGEFNPIYKSSKLSEDDFYYSHDKETGEFKRSNEIFITCELSKSHDFFIDCQELDESCKLPIYGETLGTGKNRKKKFKSIKLLDLYNTKSIFDITETNFNKCWISPKESKYSDIINRSNKIVYVFRAMIDDLGDIHKEMRMLFYSEADNSWYMSFRAPIRSEIILSAVLPSFRDPSNQLKVNQYSWFGKLVQQVSQESDVMEDLRIAFDDVNRISDSMFDQFRCDFQEEVMDRVFPDSSIHFQMNADSRSEIYKTLKVYVDDGFKSEISSKGSGFQSAFVINMFKKYADMRSLNSTAVLCIEEPELYLHPHARRVLSRQIDVFCESGHQAIITTHSTDFLNDIDFGINIISCKKTKNGTKTRQLSLKDYKNIFIFDYQTEIFFADLVIICEGLESYLIKQVAEYYHDGILDARNISVISVQGKDQIPDFAKLLCSIGIKCCIICDFDFILRDRAQTENKKHKSTPHKSLESLPDGFFRQFLEKSKGDRVSSRIQKFRSFVKGNNEKLFYTAKSVSQLIKSNIIKEEDYRGFVSDMEKAGIFLLDGEIEDIFEDESLLSSGSKFNNSKLFELHKKLKSGKLIVEFINPSPIKKMLDKILNDFI